jgi:hypothetical protein
MVKRGQRIRINRETFRIKYVNESGAYLVPDAQQVVTIAGKEPFKVDRPGIMVTNDLHSVLPIVEVL